MVSKLAPSKKRSHMNSLAPPSVGSAESRGSIRVPERLRGDDPSHETVGRRSPASNEAAAGPLPDSGQTRCRVKSLLNSYLEESSRFGRNYAYTESAGIRRERKEA